MISSLMQRARQSASNAATPKSQYMAAMNRSSTVGAGAEDEYLARAKAFDPRASLRESVGALYDQFVQGAGRKIRDLRGGMVGAGRLGGGYGELDESEAVYDMGRDLNQRVAGMALDTEAMSLRNQEGIGQFGQNVTGRYTDMLSGSLDRETAERNAKRQERASKFGALAGLAGKLIPWGK